MLVADYLNFERAAHLAYILLPGDAAAIREPWRVAVSFLAAACGSDLLRLHLPFLEQIPQTKIRAVLQ